MFRTVTTVEGLSFGYFLNIKTAEYKVMVKDQENRRQRLLTYAASRNEAVEDIKFFLEYGFYFGEFRFEGIKGKEVDKVC